MSQTVLWIAGLRSDTYIMHGVQEFCQLVKALPVLAGVPFPLHNGLS